MIGLAGGIGSGKSTAAEVLETLGAKELARARGARPEVRATLRQWWGDVVLRDDGTIDRDALRRIVKDDDKRRQLEGLMHPRIALRREALTATYRTDPDTRAIVWDSPLLFEARLAEQCDCVIFVEADRAARLQRVAAKRGWKAEELDRFENSQKPLDFKKDRADYTVVNNSDIDDLRRQLVSVFSQILSGV